MVTEGQVPYDSLAERELAGVLIAHWNGLDHTNLLRVISELRAFAYPIAPETSPSKDAEQLAHD